MHTVSALVVVASVASGAFVASAALSGVNRPASVTLEARRAGVPARVDDSVDTRDMLASIDLVNAERARLGLTPVAWHDQVAEAAEIHSTDQAVTATMRHIGSDGSDTGDRLDRVGFVWGSWGETVGAGYETPQPLIAAWMASPGHRAQLVGDYEWAGVAMVRSANGTPYWTLVLANGGS